MGYGEIVCWSEIDFTGAVVVVVVDDGDDVLAECGNSSELEEVNGG